MESRSREKRITRRTLPRTLCSKIGKARMMMMSRQRVKRSRLVYAAFSNSCGMNYSPCRDNSHRIHPFFI